MLDLEYILKVGELLDMPDTNEPVTGSPDPSIIHLAAESANYKQSLDWIRLLQSAASRNDCFEWLMQNDPEICNLYARISLLGIQDESQKHMAAVLILRKDMMRTNNLNDLA